MSRAMEKATSTPRSMSSERLKKMDGTLLLLVDILKDQSLRLTKIETLQDELVRSWNSGRLTPEASELDSLRKDVNVIKEILNKQAELLTSLGETVSDKRVVKTADGSSVTASELEALRMTKQISSKLRTTSSSLAGLANEVKRKRTTRLDAEKVADRLSQQVTAHFDEAVQKPVEGLRKDLEGLRSDMSALGSDKLAEMREAVEEVLGHLKEGQRNIEAIERRVTFVGIGRLAIAVLPLFASLLIVGGLVGGAASIFGIGPLFGWAWASFAAASVWWQKVLIAVATLGGAALFVWVVLRVAQRIYDDFR